MTDERRRAISARFRKVVAQAIERADREERELLAALRARPIKSISLRNYRKPAERH